MLEMFAKWIVGHRRLVVVVMLLVSAFFVSQIKNLKIAIDPNTMLPPQHPYVVGTSLAERVFGTNYTLVIAVAPKQGDIYQPEVLERVKLISDRLVTIPGVKKETLLSVSARRAKEIRGNADGFEVRPLMERVPQTPHELSLLKRAIETNPIYQNAIVAADGSAAAITVSLNKGAHGFRPVLEELYRFIEPLKSADIDIAVSGSPMFLSWVEVYAQRMGWLFLAALLIVGLLHLEAFRTWQGFFLPLVTAMLSVCWGLGLMGIAKVPMDAFNAATPILILAVTAGHAVQLLKRYYEEYVQRVRQGTDPRQANDAAVVASIVRVGPVMLTAGAVAVAGFFSLLTFDIDTIRTFGVFTGLGILSGLLIEMTFIPALRAWLRPPSIEHDKAGRARIWDRVAEHIAAVTTGPSRVPIYVVAVVVALVGAVGIWLVSLENSYKSYFAADLSFQQDDRLINQRMGGTNTFYVVFEGESEDAIKEPAVLRLMDDTQRFIEKQGDVGKTISIVDLLKRMNQAMTADDANAFVVPRDKNLVSQYLLLYSMSGEPGDFDLYVDYQYRRASITAFLKKDSSLYIQDLIAKVSAFIQARQLPGIKVHFGGSVPQSSALSQVLVTGKLKNMAQMGLVVLFVAALIFRSFLAGLLVLAPLAVTVFINFGLMGLGNIPLNTSTAISCALAIGLGADYAIYLLYRIKEELAAHGALEPAVRAAITTAGKAVLFVGSAIAGGYAVLLFSFGFYIHIWSAILTVTSTVVGVITSLYLIPALVISLSARFVTKPATAAKPVVVSTAAGVLAAVMLAGAQEVRAETVSAVEIMQRNFVSSKFQDSTSDATFKLINKNGDVRVRKTYGVTKLAANGEDTKRMTRFLSPSDIRNTVTVLVEHADRDDEMWVYLPALKKVRRLASSNKKDSFVGTDLSYGDVIGHKVQDWNHKLIGQEDAAGRRLYVIECTPKTPAAAANSGYSKRVHWISSESFVAEKSEFYDVQGQILKTVIANQIRKVDDKNGRWQPMQLEVRQHQTGHTTIIEFDRFSVSQGVGDEYFTPRYMEKER